VVGFSQLNLCPTRFAFFFFFFCLRWAAEHGFLGTLGPGLRRLGVRQTYISSDRFCLIHLLLFKIRANNLNPWIHSKPYLSLSPFSLPVRRCRPPARPPVLLLRAPTASGRLLWAPAAPRVRPHAPRAAARLPAPPQPHAPRAAACVPTCDATAACSAAAACDATATCSAAACAPRHRRPPAPEKKPRKMLRFNIFKIQLQHFRNTCSTFLKLLVQYF